MLVRQFPYIQSTHKLFIHLSTHTQLKPDTTPPLL